MVIDQDPVLIKQGLKRVEPKFDHKGRLLLLEMPRRVELMELASQDLFSALHALSVDQLKALQPTGPYVRLVDALIAVRHLQGESA